MSMGEDIPRGLPRQRRPGVPTARDAVVVPSHIRAMAQAVSKQLKSTHPREEIDLDAVAAVVRFVMAQPPVLTALPGKYVVNGVEMQATHDGEQP